MTRKFELSKSIAKNSEIEFLPEYDHTGNVLINIRGSNGSGKSYCVRKILEHFGNGVLKYTEQLTDEGEVFKFPYYEYDDFYLLGKYETSCGGLDGVKWYETITSAAKELIQTKSVLMEGILWSSVFSSMYRLDRDLRQLGHSSVWCGFNNPAELHLQRVMERRASRGVFEPMQIKHVIEKVKSTERGLNHAIYFGANVLIGPTEYLVENIVKILKSKSIEDVEFTNHYHFVPDLEKWSEIYRNDRDYKYSPSDELVRKYRTSNSLWEL